MRSTSDLKDDINNKDVQFMIWMSFFHINHFFVKNNMNYD